MSEVITIDPGYAVRRRWRWYPFPQESDATIGQTVLGMLVAGVFATSIAVDPVNAILTELDSLLELENTNGYTFRASDYAHGNARQYLEGIRFEMARDFRFRPSLIPDGEGGVDIEWETGNKKVALSCRGRENQRDFIYWRENGGRYDGREASPELLRDRLNWLIF